MFRPADVTDILREANDNASKARFLIGREGSPAIYIESTDIDIFELAFRGVADEVGECEPSAILRRKDDNKHRELGIHALQQAVDDGTTDREYLRVWWD